MTSADLLRGFFALLFSGILAFGFYTGTDFWDSTGYKTQFRYTPIFSPLLLPMFFVFLGILYFVTDKTGYTADLLLALFFPVFLQICFYYGVLLLLLPLLRKTISARATAALWIIPNYLYIAVHSYMRASKPLLVLKVGGRFIGPVLIIWLIGGVFVFFRGILQHLRYRHFLKMHASPVSDQRILQIWETQQKQLGMKKPKLKLYTCPELHTPVSIGLTQRGMMVLLPHTHYTDAELTMIFRHEIIHIVHCDSQTKFFLLLCTALCWFNPLMHLAARRCADDLELSCDELVLVDTEDISRQEYAGLILSAAGDDRGFTTCLSTGAAALKYRLSRIMQPGRRMVGGIVVGIVFFFLLISNGSIALAYNNTTADQVISDFLTTREFSSFSLQLDGSTRMYQCDDPDALMDIFRSLQVSKLTGDYDFEPNSRLFFTFSGENGVLSYISLDDHQLSFGTFANLNARSVYYLPTPPDWERIRQILTWEPESTVGMEDPFHVSVYFSESADYTDAFSVDLIPATVSEILSDGTESFTEYPAGDAISYASSGDTFREFHLSFDRPPVSYSVKIRGQNGEEPYVVADSGIPYGSIPLADYHAIYEITATFTEQDDRYEITYFFEIDPAIP